MSTYRLKDFVDPIAITVQDPANSGFERFVGLEHYDSNELVIKRFSGVELLTTNAKAFQKNDLLIARRNVYLRRAGVVYFDGITSGDSIVLRVKEACEKQTGISRELAQRVLPLVLNTDRFWIYANKHADGMNSKRISKDTLLDYEFNLPSIEEQKVLADKLWAAYKVKESYRQLLSTTDEMLKAKFQEMFGEADFPKKKISDLLADNFSGEWGEEDVDNSGTFVIKTNNFNNDGSIDFTQLITRDIDAKRVERKQLKSGDILLERSGGTKDNPVGRVVYFDKEGTFVTNNFVQTLRTSEIVNSKYLFYSLYIFYNTQKMEIRRLGHQTSGIQNLDFHKFVDREVKLPPMKLQQQFAEIVTQAEATKASLRASIEAIDRVIRSLINQ